MTAPTGTTIPDINGLAMYVETHGEGEPVVLLHGGISASAGLEPTIAALAGTRRVIVPHMQGHGHTADIDRPFASATFADDVAALLDHLGIPRADIVGYSMGGGVATRLAIRHPDRVRRLVVVSEPMRRDGWFPEVIAQFDGLGATAEQIGRAVAGSPLGERFPAVDWTALFRKTGEMVVQDYDLSADVAALPMPVMLVFADADGIIPGHMIEFWQAVGGGQRDAGLDGSARPAARLAIIPDRTHYDLMRDDAVARLVLPFLVAD